MHQVQVASLPPERFRSLIGDGYGEVEEAIARGVDVFRGRAVWHLNSTARGGGVVELLQSLLAYARGAGVDTRWAVIDGDPDFFALTKRIHNRLHGWSGDGGPLEDAERELYESTLNENLEQLDGMIRPGDVVFCHDPQTAGLVPPLGRRGANVVWRCHVGADDPNDVVREAWRFLMPYVEPADAYVFSRREFAWEGLDEGKLWVVPPSIDAFSPKNQDLSPESVGSILDVAGLLRDGGIAPTFTRIDGSPGRVDRAAEIDQEAPIPPDARLIAQVSRWDLLKDPAGVARGFADHIADRDVHLVLAGPAVDAVSDDPEGAQVLADVRALRADMAREARERIHLVCLPMVDAQENAAMVNAIQRRADVVVQKSLAEGFGLTVAEAMWKARPVVASRRGGIQDILAGDDVGILLDDPTDLEEFARACAGLLADPERAERIGANARRRVTERFLGTRQLVQYLRLLDELID